MEYGTTDITMLDAIKPQDIVVLAKLIAQQGNMNCSQNRLASELCLSPS